DPLETMGPSDRWVLGSRLSQVWEDSTIHVGKMMMTLNVHAATSTIASPLSEFTVQLLPSTGGLQMASPTKDLFAGRGGGPAGWKPTITNPDLSTWQVKDFGGGYGQVTHSAALLFWLTGLRAQEVTCRVSSPHPDVDMYDAAIVRFTNGALGVVSGAAT